MRPFCCVLLLLLVGACAGAGPAARGDPGGPCTCREGKLVSELDAVVHERAIKGRREAALQEAQRQTLLRLAFSLAFCEPRPPAFASMEGGTIRLQGTSCLGKKRGPRPWPQLVEVTCESGPLPPLPEGFDAELSGDWSVSGEELNRVYSKSLRVARRDESCQGRPEGHESPR